MTGGEGDDGGYEVAGGGRMGAGGGDGEDYEEWRS